MGTHIAHISFGRSGLIGRTVPRLKTPSGICPA